MNLWFDKITDEMMKVVGNQLKQSVKKTEEFAFPAKM